MSTSAGLLESRVDDPRSSLLAIRALGVLLACHCAPGLLVADQKDSAPSTFPRVQQRGLFIHDPSTIAECNKQFWVFSTGPGISSWHSADLTHWTPEPRVFTNAPSWKDLLRGGGTLFLDSKGKFIGPGHAGVYSNSTTNWLTFHYYDGTRHGAATLALRSLNWTGDGWPQLGEFRSGQ